MSHELIRSASLSDFVPVAQALGLEPLRLVREVGLDAACLGNPDIKISIRTLDQLLERAASLSGHDDFGLRLAEKRTLSNLGPVGLMLREEPDLRRFLTSAMRYLYLHNEAISVQTVTEEPVVSVRIQFVVDGGPLGRQSVELATGVLYRSLKAIMGTDWTPWGVCFAHAPPRSFEVHHRLFGQGVSFLQDFDGVMIRSADLDRPAPTADPVMARYARQYLDSLIGDGQGALEGKVRQLVSVLLPAGRCNIDNVAKYLGVDRRTIHRQLLKAGTSFSDLVIAIRKDLVVRYLVQSPRSMTETTGLLGFSGQSGFSRWFREQYGCTAQQWQREQRAAAAIASLDDGAGRLPRSDHWPDPGSAPERSPT